MNYNHGGSGRFDKANKPESLFRQLFLAQFTHEDIQRLAMHCKKIAFDEKHKYQVRMLESLGDWLKIAPDTSAQQDKEEKPLFKPLGEQ